MKIIDLNLPTYPAICVRPCKPGVYDRWMFDSLASGMRPPMTDQEIVADFMKTKEVKNNRGRISEW